jgi:hypothetical protein
MCAADGANGPQDKIGFGFDKLRWGITQHDANALYHFSPGMTWDYDGCRFRVLAGFLQGKLALFTLLATGTGASETCGAKIKTELTALYGQPQRQQMGGSISPDAVHADWKTSGLIVNYNSWKLTNFDHDPAGPGFDGKVEISFFPP